MGGQIQIGHRVNVYRVRKVDRQSTAIRPVPEDTVVIPIGGKGAEAELLAAGIPVVDVRAKQGEPANRVTAPSQIEQTARPEPGKPLQILTVAVDHETALGLVELAVEEQGAFEIWVSLAPLAEPREGE